MTSLDDLPPGTKALHTKTQTVGTVTTPPIRLRDGTRGSVAWTGDRSDPWRVFVRWPLGGGMWCAPDELEVL